VAKNFGNLGDLFPDKDLRCRVRGCTNLWTMEGHAAMRKLASEDAGFPERMCDECYARFQTLADQQVACSSPDCANTWGWNRFQQLEAAARGYTGPPQRFCPDCLKKVGELEDKQIPCRMRACSNTWTWPRAKQLTAPDEKPPSRLCDDCFSKLKTLADRELKCRVRTCENTWTWSRYQQLEHMIGGKDLEQPPPARLCKTCFEAFRQFADVEVPCKIRECERTWTFRAFQQLEHRAQHGADAPPPERMCQPCYEFFTTIHDIERPCRNRGCRNTWTYTRGWQLRDRLKGRKRPPQLMCRACTEKRASLEDRQLECTVPGCPGTWTYVVDDQLKDGALKRQPRARRCDACEQFLVGHEAVSVACTQCSAQVQWSAYEQLLCERGTFVKPELCSDCAGKEFREHTPPQTGPTEHHHVVRMPAGGKWGSDPEIAAWPPHLDYEAIARAEQADLRVVALGDDLTLSSANREESWPFLLEQKLAAALAAEGQTVAVINAGIPGTTSRQALVRLPRDVLPFAPHLIIFSFAFGDSAVLIHRHDQHWQPRLSPDEADTALAMLCRKLKATRAGLLYWTTNPMFPHDHAAELKDPAFKAWADEQQTRKQQTLAHAGRVCAEHGIEVLDLRSRFEVNGERSAKRWMVDWCNHNPTGARNIATWMADHIVHQQLKRQPDE